jgi:hypothetical protein
MAPQATTAPGTRLHPSLAGHVRPRHRAPHGSPHGQCPRQRAYPNNDATATSRDLHRRPQAHTALRAYRQHAGLSPWHGRAQGDGSDDDAGKQLPVRVWVPRLVPRHRVSTSTLAHASFPDTGCSTLPRAPPSPLCCCCCGGGGDRGPAKVPLARPPPRASTRSVVEDAPSLLSVPPACLCPYPDADVS